CAGVERALGMRRDPAQACGALRVFDGLHGAEWHRVGDIDRHLGGRSLKDAHLLEGDLNGQSELSNFSFVDLRRGIEHDEEGKQKGDEIGVGDQPAVAIGGALGSIAATHGVDTSGASAGSWAAVRNPSSFSSSMCGFIPSRMETTPSSVISRMICSSRMRIFSFPATGSKRRLAAPTP